MKAAFVLRNCNMCWDRAGRPVLEDAGPDGLPLHYFPAVHHDVQAPGTDRTIDLCQSDYDAVAAPFIEAQRQFVELVQRVGTRPVPGQPDELPPPALAQTADNPAALPAASGVVSATALNLHPQNQAWCLGCDKFFGSTPQLVGHSKVHHGLNTIPEMYGEQCPVCGKHSQPSQHSSLAHDIKGGMSILFWMATQPEVGDQYGLVAKRREHFSAQGQLVTA